MKMKKLLAAAMAATMIFSSMVTSLVASADSVGTIAAGNVTVCPTDAATVDVDVNIPLGAGITAPHIMLEFLLDGYKLTGATSTVIGANDITVNADAGKIIIETAVKDAPTLTAIDLKVSFAVVDAAAAGTYNLTVNVLDATNVEEEDVVIGGTTATVTVAHAHKAAVTAPTCTAEGFTTYTCACGDTYKGDTVAALGHSFVEGTCTVCGEADPDYVPPVTGPVVNEALATAVYEIAPRVENTFGIRYDLYLNPADFGGDSFEFRITRSSLDTANGFVYSDPTVYTYTVADTEVPDYAAWNMYAFSHSFPLYEMQVPTTYSLHIFKEGVEVCYYAYEPHTLAQVATKRYNDQPDNVSLRKILVACLNVGTKAQELFGQNNTTSADSPLKTYAAPNAGVDTVTYATSYDSLDATAGSFSGAIYETSVTLGIAPTLRCDLYDGSLWNAADSFYAEASYDSKYTGKKESYTFAGTELVDLTYGMYALEFDKTFLFDTDKEITVNIKKNDGTVIGTAVTTIDALLIANVNASGVRGEAFQAVASFAACCRDFFPNF